MINLTSKINKNKEPKPSKEMLKALKEAKDISKNPDKYKGYHNIDQMFNDILNK